MSVGRLPMPSHPPGGPQSLLAGGRASEAFRRPPTGQEGHLPPREVSLPPGGQNPITLEYQPYPPTIDTIVTGMGQVTIDQTNDVDLFGGVDNDNDMKYLRLLA